MSYQIDILDHSLDYLATVHNTPALDKSGNWLEYSQKLSDVGRCKLRVGTLDPLLASEGDILSPFKNHIRVKRSGVVVWQGVIVRNTKRTRDFVEVEARTYLYLLSRVLIRHDASDGAGAENYRTLKSGTLAADVTTLVGEAKVDMGAPLSSLSVGTVENPLFPADYKDSAGVALSGQWTFSDTFQLKFDYRDMLYVLQALAIYGNSDFEVTNGLVFNFKKYIGNKQPNITFSYGEFGNIEDFDAPLDGEQMANAITGVAADNNFQILHTELTDTTSINTYGRIAAVAAYGDVKNVNLLTTRIREELIQVATPDPEIHLLLNDKAYPLGQYGLGDTVTIVIKTGSINVNSQRRIVATDIKVHTTGKETIRLITNKPKDTQ